MAETIFLDTGFIIAFFNKDDKNYTAANRIIQDTLKDYPSVRFYFSDYVFDEVITLMKARHVSINSIIDIGNRILASRIWTRITINEEIFQKT
jgi:predicted nucleic acid-binding protein